MVVTDINAYLKEHKLYKVEFMTKEKRQEIDWRIDVEAKSRDEALAKAKDAWQRKPHMFHIECHLLKPTEEFLYHTFKRIETQ